jgi:hypothetical protein
MKEILLTQGKVALVDDEDYGYLMQWKWCLRGTGLGKFYAIRGFSKSKKSNIKGSISMHRQLMKPEKGYVIDHLDGNTLNNQKNNLRICTNSQNLMNRNKTVKNLSGYKGVSYDKKMNKFRAQIVCNRKRHYLGLYVNPVDAAYVYNQAAIKLHGEFAKLNDI